MKVIVQLDKEDFDLMAGQAAHNRAALATLSNQVALTVFDGLLEAIDSAENQDQIKATIRAYLAKRRELYGFEVSNKALKSFDHEHS